MDNLQAMTIVRFSHIGNYTLELLFLDETIQVIDFKPVIGYGWMKELLDPSYFNQVRINEGGNLEWPNGQDFNPEALYDWPHFAPLYIQEADSYLRQA